MEIFIAIVIFILTVILTTSDGFAKKSSDMFMNIVISVIIFGISIYSFVRTGFDFSIVQNLITNLLYILSCIAGGVDIYFYVRNVKKYGKAHSNEPEKVENPVKKMEETPVKAETNSKKDQ